MFKVLFQGVKARQLEQLLHDEIPLSSAMGVEVGEIGDDTVTLRAPAEPNGNHLGTAFAGSINALATLSGYCLVWCLLDEAAAKGVIVVWQSKITYKRPVRGELRAICYRPAAADVESFKRQFAATGRARIDLRSEVAGVDNQGTSFRGTFIVLRPDAGAPAHPD